MSSQINIDNAIQEKLQQIQLNLESAFSFLKYDNNFYFRFDFPEVENNDSDDYLDVVEAFEKAGLEIKDAYLEHDCYSGIVCLTRTSKPDYAAANNPYRNYKDFRVGCFGEGKAKIYTVEYKLEGSSRPGETEEWFDLFENCPEDVCEFLVASLKNRFVI